MQKSDWAKLYSILVSLSNSLTVEIMIRRLDMIPHDFAELSLS